MNQTLVQWLEKSRGKAWHHAGRFVFKIDDESKEDVVDMCCQIQAQFDDRNSDSFILQLSRVPRDEELESLVQDLGGNWSGDTRWTSVLKLNFTSKDYGTINRLALAIRRVVGRGKQYVNSNWKWVAPRAAQSLKQFAQELRAYRSSLHKQQISNRSTSNVLPAKVNALDEVRT